MSKMFHKRNRLATALSLALSLVMMFSVSAPAFAAGGIQGNLAGTVRDASTQAPIADVSVSAQSPSGSFSGSTDGGGRFTLLGLPADTYTVSFSKTGYDSISMPGVAVFGDETDSVGVVRLNKSLKTIVHVTSRARNSAYQPTQTQDVTTLSGQRITQAIGYSTNQNEQNLILAAPGAINDSSGNVSIRGSLNVELGYQYDGVNFSGVFFDENASQGFLSNITGGSGGSLQVVSGSGDATQGNIGAGVINIVPPRGTYPASGLASISVGEPHYDHGLNLNYGFATPNNRFSDFLSYDGSRFLPNGTGFPASFPAGVDAATAHLYANAAYSAHDDLTNNMVFRFGHNNNMSVQWLMRAADLRTYANYGQTLPSSLVQYYPNDPFYYNSYVNNPFTGAPEFSSLSQFQSVTPLIPGVRSDGTLPTTPEESSAQPLSFNKVAYTWNINPTTFLSLSYANLYLISAQANNLYSGSLGNSNTPQSVFNGGQRLADELDLTHQFGSNHTTTLAIRYEDDLPVWEQSSPWFGNFAAALFSPAGAVAPSIYGGTNIAGYPYAPSDEDWYLPANTNAPVSTGNPCLGATGAVDPTGCYIYDYLQANGKWTGTLPREPMLGLNYHHTIFHEGGVGIRDQWTVNSRLHLDYGLREDIANYDWGENPFGNGADKFSNPSDEPLSAMGPQFQRPRFTEPRFAASYLLGPNDSLRFSYGRSVEFPFAQTAGTPFDMPFADSMLIGIPSKDSATGIAILNATGLPQASTVTPLFGGGAGISTTNIPPGCGSGYNPFYPPHQAGFGPANQVNFWPCNPPTNQYGGYLQQWFWQIGDQNFDAPDLGNGTGTPSYNNWDVAWGHQFTKGTLDGFGMKITGFARHGYSVPQDIVLKYAPPDPITGQQNPAVFTVLNEGVERTNGLEFMLTAPDRPSGWSGFLTMNYISQFENVPPVATGGQQYSDSLPLVGAKVLESGQMFRSGYLPPFQGRLSVSYATKSGWKINPIFSFDGGYPVGIGSDTFNIVNGNNAWFPSSDLPGAAPLGGSIGPYEGFNAPAFVDPGNPGSLLHPNIIATRGVEPALPGGQVSRAHGQLDFDLEWSPQGSPWTLGAYVANVFNQQYGVYYSNTQYQPIATGISGPQSGQSGSAYPGSFTWINGARDQYSGILPNSPYNVPLQSGTNVQFYLQRKL